MYLSKRGRIFLIICLLSFLFSYLIITLNYFPHLGFSLTLITFALFSYRFLPKKNKEARTYLNLTLLFSAFLFIRSDPFLTFLNLCASLFFGSLMLLSGRSYDKGLIGYLTSPLNLIGRSVFVKSDIYPEQKGGNSNIKKSLNTVFGILVTILLLIIVIPLLSSANPIFGNNVGEFLKALNINSFFDNLNPDDLFVFFMRFVFFLIFIFIIPKILTAVSGKTDFTLPYKPGLGGLSLTIPKIALSLVLVLFVITQLQLYFADIETLSRLGITYSQRAREVFGQLSVVSIISYLLIHNDKRFEKNNVLLNHILGLLGLFLVAMAFISAIQYILAWGLTGKRLYGIAVAVWIAGIFLILFSTEKNGSEKIVKASVLYSGVMLALINLFNFDYLIYHFAKAKTGEGVDYTYLSTLSADSLSYKDQFDKLKETTDKKTSIIDYNNKNPLVILYKIESLQRKYEDFDLRTYNFFDYIEYRKIKNVNTGELRNLYQQKQLQQS